MIQVALLISVFVCCFIAVCNAQFYDGVAVEIGGDSVLFGKDDYDNDDFVNSDIAYKKIHRTNSEARIKAYQDYIIKGSSEAAIHSFTSIHCHNYKDFYRLLYKICNNSVLCRELYYIDSPSMFMTNFKRFVYQLSLTQLFIIHNFNGNSNDAVTPSSISDRPFILEDAWPIEWNPRYIIVLKAFPVGSNESSYCHNAFDLRADENIPFVWLSLHLLQTFKTFIVNEYHCHDFNERLVLDSQNKPHCICIQGKSCDNTSTYTIIIIAMLVVGVLIALLLAIGIFLSLSRTIKKIDAINRSGKEKNQ